jgi:hypothetical protein
VAALNLAGTGDEFTLALASSQPTEVSIIPGGTATFDAQVNPDSVFGQNGEQVTFVCPTNLPINTSCEITPCPASVTAATAATFQIKFVTSSATVVAPRPTTGCSSYGRAPASVPPAGPGPAIRAPHAPLFPAPTFAALLLALALMLAGMALLGARRRRVPLVFALAGVAALAFTGCHHASTAQTPATPVAVTTMTLHANALDANGNPLNASRSLQVILDVIAR